jgi:hypothetical protein
MKTINLLSLHIQAQNIYFTGFKCIAFVKENFLILQETAAVPVSNVSNTIATITET